LKKNILSHAVRAGDDGAKETGVDGAGDAYLVIGGAPHRADSGPTVARKVALFALDAMFALHAVAALCI